MNPEFSPIKPSYINYIKSLYKLTRPDNITKNIVRNVEQRNYMISRREKAHLERYRTGDTSRYPYTNENMESTKLTEIIKEIIKMKFDGGPTGGRRYIPDFINVPLSSIKKLNSEKGGPHIKRTRKGDEIILLISSYLRIALEESKRGRTTRQGEIDKNQLLKRFDEIFKDSFFKGALKKSVQGAKQMDTPFGPFIPSNLKISVEDQSNPDILKIKNPSTFNKEV
jgi:hypothetical protein